MNDLKITEEQLLAELEKFRPASARFEDLTKEQKMLINLAFNHDRPLKHIAFQTLWENKYGWKISDKTLQRWKEKVKV